MKEERIRRQDVIRRIVVSNRDEFSDDAIELSEEYGEMEFIKQQKRDWGTDNEIYEIGER